MPGPRRPAPRPGPDAENGRRGQRGPLSLLAAAHRRFVRAGKGVASRACRCNLSCVQYHLLSMPLALPPAPIPRVPASRGAGMLAGRDARSVIREREWNAPKTTTGARPFTVCPATIPGHALGVRPTSWPDPRTRLAAANRLRSYSPRLTLARNTANLCGVTARWPRSGDLLSRTPATAPAAVLPTSTQLPPLPPLALALTHFKLSLTAVHS